MQNSYEVCPRFPRISVGTHVTGRAAIVDHPLPVLQYAAVHGYPELSNSAAPHTISLSFDKVTKTLRHKPGIRLSWVCVSSEISKMPKMFNKTPEVKISRVLVEDLAVHIRLRQHNGLPLHSLSEFAKALPLFACMHWMGPRRDAGR